MPDNRELIERAGQRALALLKVMLIDGAMSRPYRRLAIELLTASGQPLECAEESPLLDRSLPVPRPEPTGFLPEAAYFQDVLRSSRGISHDVSERILLLLNQR